MSHCQLFGSFIIGVEIVKGRYVCIQVKYEIAIGEIIELESSFFLKYRSTIERLTYESYLSDLRYLEYLRLSTFYDVCTHHLTSHDHVIVEQISY